MGCRGVHRRLIAVGSTQSEGGLDDKVEEIIKAARSHGVPVIFALSRRSCVCALVSLITPPVHAAGHGRHRKCGS